MIHIPPQTNAGGPVLRVMRRSKIIATRVMPVLAALVLSVRIARPSFADSPDKSTEQPVNPTKDITLPIVVGLATAVFTSIGAYLIFRAQLRRQPKKQLTYNLRAERGEVIVPAGLRSKVRLQFEGEIIEDLQIVSAMFISSGNIPIREQALRVEFPATLRLIAGSFENEPEPELGATLDVDTTPGKATARIGVQYFPPNKTIVVRFIASAKESALPVVHARNDKDDVTIIAGPLQTKLHDGDLLVEFFYGVFGFVTVPRTVTLLLPPFLFQSEISGLFSVLFLLLMLRRLPIAARAAFVLIAAIATAARKDDDTRGADSQDTTSKAG